MKKIYSLLLMFVCVSINAWAQQTINLNSEKANNQLILKKVAAPVGISPEYLKEAKAARVFSINPALQHTESVKIGDVVNLQLFETDTYTATVTNKITDVNGTLALTLKLPDYPMAFAIITTSKDGKSLVTVSIPELGRSFGSRYDANAYYLIEIDESKQEVFECENDAVISEELETTENSPQLRAGKCGSDAYSNPSDPAQIDVLIVYTPAVANSSYVSGYGGINLVIANMIASGNTCLGNSQTGITLKLAHSEQVAYSETGNMTTSLNHLAGTSDGFMDNVHTMRKQYHADLVQLISTDNTSAGLGRLLTDTKGNIGDAFSVVLIDVAVANLSSIHELGHNMGLGHGANHINKNNGIFPYSLGWDWTGTTINGYGTNRYCSVMSYPGGGNYSDGVNRYRVPYFSNPYVTYEGQPTGNAAQADAARSLREMKHVIADYSDRLDNLLNAPTNIVVSNPTNNGATISWDAVANATKYRAGIYISGNSGSYYLYNPNPDTNNTLTVTSPNRFSPGTTYYFWVEAINECGDAASSPILTFTTNCVTTLPATNVTNTTATLNKIVTENGTPVTEQGFKYKKTSESIWQTSLDGNLTNLTAATEYEFYAYVTTASAPFTGNVLTFKTASCSNTCNYTLIAYAKFGDGWDGAELVFKQNSIEVGRLTAMNHQGKERPSSDILTIPLCSGITTEMYFVSGDWNGAFDENISFTLKDDDGNTITSESDASTLPKNTAFFTFTPSCVLPGTRTWNGTTHDWTVATNWTPARVPTANDDVVIPKIASSNNYPVVPAGGATIKNIKIEAGAEIGNQHLLSYDKAFVQYNFNGTDSRGRWHMLSVPLQEAYPGDFTFGGYPATWVRNFKVKDESGNTTTNAGWETAAGSNTPFSIGSGFIVWLDEADGIDNKGLQLSNGILELPYVDNASVPKDVHHTHDYVPGINGDIIGQSTFYNYELSGNQYIRIPGEKYQVNRTKKAYQLAGSSVTEPLNFRRDDNYGSDFALVGNPFMASLDFDKLQSTNGNNTKIKRNYQVWTGKGNAAGYVGYNPTGAFGIMVDSTTDKYIAPMQSFIVEKATNYNFGDLEFNISMTDTGQGSLRSAVNNADKLSIAAKNEVAEVLTFVAKREGGQDIFGDRDARKLMNGISNVPEIYTLKPAGSQRVAVGANIINNDNLLIPVGLATAYAGEITLTFTGMDAYDAKITLVDTEIKFEKDLTGLASYEYSFDYAGQSAPNEDRFFIRFSPSNQTGLPEIASESITVYSKEGFIRVVSSNANPINQVLVYNQQGALVYESNVLNTAHYTTHRALVSGVYVVKVVSGKGVQNVKLVVK